MSLWPNVSVRVARKDAGTTGAAPPRRAFWPFDRFATIGGALLLAIALGDALAISMQRDASLAAYSTATTNLARGMSAQTAHSLQRVDRILEQVATAAASRELGDERAVALLQDGGRAMAELAAFALTDARGRVMAATPGRWGQGVDISSSSAFKNLHENGSTAPQVVAGDAGFVLGRRVLDAEGRFAGVVLAQLSAPALRDFYSIAMPPRRKLTLMSDTGVVLVQYPPQASLSLAAHAERLAISKGACDASIGPDLVDDLPVVATVCRFKDLPFTLETTATQGEALAFWRQERVWLVVGGALAGLLVIWLLHVFARQMRRLEVSERSLAEKKLQAETAHGQLDVALSNITQGVCFFDADRRLIVANRRFGELYGLPESLTVAGAQLSDIVEAICEHGGLSYLHRERFVASFELVARARTPHASVFELGGGRTISVQSQILPDGGWVGTHEDITERRRAEDKISYLARHDQLTGLVNRSVVMERLEKLADAGAGNDPFAVLFIDLDRFKAVNDTLGHDVGDALLKLVAERLRQAAPARSMIARFGGDEFVILATDFGGVDRLAELARSLIETVSAPYRIDQHEIEIGASIGIAISTKEMSGADALLKYADIALYQAKAQGRGDYQFYGMESQQRPGGENWGRSAVGGMR